MNSTASTVDIIFNGRDKFSGVSKRVGTGLTDIGTKARTMGANFGDMGNRIRGMFSGIGATVATFGVGMGMGSMVKTAMGAEMRMARLANATQMSSDEVSKLQSQIFEVSNGNGISINADETLAALEQITEKTGNIQYATDNMKNMALAIAATGASGEAMGAVFSDMNEKFGLSNADDVLNTLSTLNEQGKAGAFTLKELAVLGNRVMSAYASTGRSGATGLQEMGAALQVIRKGTGSSDQAATAFESVLADLQDPTKIGMIAELGVSVKDAAGNMRPITDIMVDITDKASEMGNAGEILNTIFGRQSKRAFNFLITEKQKLGKSFKDNTSMKDFMGIQGSSNQLMTDAARASNTMQGAMERLNNIWKQFSITTMNSGAGKIIADFILSLDVPTVLAFLDVFSKIALGFVVVSGAIKVATIVANVYTGVMATMRSVMSAYTAAQWLANGAILASPVGWVVAGVAALVAVVILLVKYWDEFVAILKTGWSYIEKIVDAIKSVPIIGKAMRMLFGKEETPTAVVAKQETAMATTIDTKKTTSMPMQSPQTTTPANPIGKTAPMGMSSNQKLQVLIKVEGNGKASVVQAPEGAEVHLEQYTGNTVVAGGQ